MTVQTNAQLHAKISDVIGSGGVLGGRFGDFRILLDDIADSIGAPASIGDRIATIVSPSGISGGGWGDLRLLLNDMADIIGGSAGTEVRRRAELISQSGFSGGRGLDFRTVLNDISDYLAPADPPVITSSLTAEGDVGSPLSIELTADIGVIWSISGGADAALFSIFGNSLSLDDVSTDGDYVVDVQAADPVSGAVDSETFTFTLNPADALPTLTLTVSAVDGFTIQCTFDDDAAYASYQAAINGDLGGFIPLDGTKQIHVENPGAEYDVQVRGVTAVADLGPWSAIDTITMPAEGMADTFQGVDFTDSSSVTYNFDDKAIGAADSRRRVVVAVFTHGNSHTHGTSMVTGNAGAISFTRLTVPAPNATDTTPHVSLWEAEVPSGTTIDLAVTPSAAPSRCGIGWWTHGRGAAGTGAIDTASPMDQALTVVDGGMVIGAFGNANATDITATWSNLTEDFNQRVSNVLTRLGARGFFPTGGSMNVGLTPSAGTPNRFVAVPWGARETAPVEAGTTADMADSFVESIGVNCHFNFNTPTDSVWRAEYSSGWLSLLKDSGIRYVRTAFLNGASSQSTTYIADIFANAGMKVMLLLNPKTSGSFDVAKLTNQLNTAESFIGAAKIVAFDGPNEVNQSGSLTGDWAQKTVDFMSTMYTAIRARSAFDDVLVGGASVWGRSRLAVDEVLTKNSGQGWAPYCDTQGVHNYTGGRRPTVGGVPLDDDETGDPLAETTLDETLADHQLLAPGKPLFVGEWGQDAVSSLAPGYAATFGITSEAAQSKYVSRGLFENYIRGVTQTYIYALLNNQTATFYGMKNQNKGVAAPNANSGPPYTYNNRAVYTTIQRLISIMEDPGDDFTPDALVYSFTGDGANGDLHHKLFQKRDGVFYLLVTHDGISWKRSSPVGDLNPTASVTLNVTAANVKTWTPHSGATATDLGSGSSFNLTVPDHLMIVEITP